MENSDLTRRILLSAISGVGAVQAIPGVASPGNADGTPPATAIDVRQFGARCDGRSDDSKAVQAAVDAALRNSLPPPINVPGLCRLDQAIVVRRPVDTTKSILRFVGSGPGAGFKNGSLTAMFVGESRKGGEPGTEFVRFEHIRFEAGIAGAGPALSGDFLRITFAFCEFIGIASLVSDHYAQEWRFINCLARGWKGPFFQSAGGYGVTSTCSKYQFGGSGFKIADPSLRTAGCVGCSFAQDIFEGSVGPFLEFELGKGVSVAGLYSEGNEKPTIVVGARAENNGVSVSGCFFGTREDNRSSPTFAEIEWNSVRGGVSFGNTALGRLHQRDIRVWDFVSLGDHSDAAK